MIQLYILTFFLFIFYSYLSFCCCNELVGSSNILDDNPIIGDNLSDDHPDDTIPLDLHHVQQYSSGRIGQSIQSLYRDEARIIPRGTETDDDGHQYESKAQIARREQEISLSFTLINTLTDQPVGDLTNNSIIDLQKFGNNLSIMAIPITASVSIGKIVFILDNNIEKEEKDAPYLLGGNIGIDYISSTSLTNPMKFNIPRNMTILIYSATETSKILSIATIIFQVKDSGSASMPAPAPVSTISQSAPTDVKADGHHPNGAITGELKLWHKITIGYDGPITSEISNPNPFTDYQFDVTFFHVRTKHKVTIPGYYAADGNAANTGATSGNVWLVHFIPHIIGKWNWRSSFRLGTNIAMNDNDNNTTTSAGYFDKKKGKFIINSTNKKGRDLRSKGLLQYVNDHYLRYAGSREYFVKAGADSPENFLAYVDFDNTPNNGNYRKTWAPHIQDYKEMKQTTWMNGKGKGIIGAINYLSNQGMNAISMLTMNIEGDDKNVFPYIQTNDFQRIDVSKMAQWEIVFEHADRMGMLLHFKTQETENDQLLDGGALGMNRKLYYRELIARFGHHLAIIWNLGEETTNTNMEIKSYSDYFKANDPYKHLIVVHTYPGQQKSVYDPLLGYKNFTGVSLQTDRTDVAEETRKWIKASADAGHKWVVSSDEITSAGDGVVPDANDMNHDTVRKNVLWGNLMNNGGGVEYYFGYQHSNSDLTCQDYRSRANMWKLSNIALNFFNNFSIPFWLMKNSATTLLSSKSSNFCMETTSGRTTIIVYLLNEGTDTINLSSFPSNESFSVRWYDPMTGGSLQNGTISTITGGGIRAIGLAPSNTSRDWALLIRKL